uniref:Uncharacterized protein LOC109687660 n=1 Tax=Castor canadensis TaxID=51338 RepID=A0A8B7USK2_CASCN|nr:uncharacterized protein LOC109687660 [Castor canadensis]
MEPPETAASHSSPGHSLLRAQGTSHPPGWPLCHPAEQAAVSNAESPSQPADRQERTAVFRGIGVHSPRTQRATRLHYIFNLPFRWRRASMRTWSPPVTQATTPATTGPPSLPTSAQAHPAYPQRAISPPRRARRAPRRHRSSRQLGQWLDKFFSFPLSSMASQLNASSTRCVWGGQSPSTLRTRASSRGSSRAFMENPQVQGSQDISLTAFPPLGPPERAPISLGQGPLPTGLEPGVCVSSRAAGLPHHSL